MSHNAIIVSYLIQNGVYNKCRYTNKKIPEEKKLIV